MVGNPNKHETTIMKKKMRQKQSSLPEELRQDDRFKDVISDPKFRLIPKKEAKVKIDQRFGRMFTDKRFKIKATMDKRGRPVSTTSAEDLRRYYHLDESDNGDTDDASDGNENATCLSSDSAPVKLRQTDQVRRDEKVCKKSTKFKTKLIVKKKKTSKPSSDSEDSEGELLDFARGEGNIETSEDDSSDSSDDGAAIHRAEKEQEIEWDELDKDAPRSDDISRRLAVCNMDWHNIKAADLFVLMESFALNGGIVKAVTIYPSEFGKERMLEEAKRGPRLKARNEQALRKYEFERLRYYYAVVECDNSDTANNIYESCDGMEYQSSGAKLDLRFIPDEIVFDEKERTDFCDSSPQDYEPVDFINSALMLSTCESSWDGDDLRRRKALSKAYSSDSKNKRQRAAGLKPNDIDKMAEYLKTYIASSDNEDASDAEKIDTDQYRKLLQLGDGNKDDQQSDSDTDDEEGGNKEITFNPELNATVDRRRKEKNDSEKVSKPTPFQEYLQRKKEKKREKRQLERERKKQERAFSDDDLPEGVEDDPFFEIGRNGGTNKRHKGDQNSSKVETNEVNEQIEAKRRQQLELLLMDEEDDGRKHFSLKKILKTEQTTNGKSKKKGKVATEDDDNFKINLDDSRFAAIYSDHRFNIDPTDLGYKKTKAMEAIMTEKAKRRKLI